MNVLITGGASGLGEAITRKLAGNSEDQIYFTFNKSLDNALAIEREYPNTKRIQCDFLKKSDMDFLMDFFVNSDMDVLINNAFMSNISTKHFHKTDISVFRDNFNANIIPVVQITQKAILHFRKKKFGKIITVLSSAIIDNPPLGWSEYVAEKSYLASLCKSWATENISFNITSNSVSPSFMLTSLTQNIDERIIEEIKETNPLKQLLTLNEVADTIYFLSKSSQQINGMNIIINAGTHVV